MADASIGHQTRISAATTGTTIASYSEAVEIVSESLRKDLTILDTAGIRGTRSHPKERTRDGTYTVAGTITCHATPTMLDNWLPRILGAAESSDTFALAETLTEFDILIDRVAKRFQYVFCKVSRATFRSTAGGLLELSMDIVAKTETVSATTFPTITAPTDPPYVHQDCVLTTQAAGHIITEVEIVIDNMIQPRFSNSQTATDLSPRDRIVTVNFTTPYTSTEIGLYGINTGSAAAATVVYTNGGYVTTFSIANLQVPDQSPVIESRDGEIFLRHRGVAKKSSTTNELIVTHDSVA